MAPFLGRTSIPIEEAIASIEDVLVAVKDGMGGEYWPSLGINTIGSMIPGNGYYINVEDDINLIYPAAGNVVSRVRVARIK